MSMHNKPYTDEELLKKKEMLKFLDKNSISCDELSSVLSSHLGVADYIYSTNIAVEELGLDEELVNQLVEDYVVQIIKSKAVFAKYLDNLKKQKNNNKELDYVDFRELAHKNLGVARNLRIEDAQKLIYELMTKDDLDYLGKCLDVLMACAVRLRPELAQKTIKLIEVKNSF